MLSRDEAWNPDYRRILEWRQRQVLRMRADEGFVLSARAYYADHPSEFISHWCDTVDPRRAGSGGMTRIPFILFRRQRELIEFLRTCLEHQTSGLIEKSRDMGATWACVGFSAWAWLYLPGASIGWGSRKAALVDRLGDMDSIFEKTRALIMGLPRPLLPKGFSRDNMTFMKVLNPETGSSITGESGDEIGRGGRKLMYFKDESAHYERPERIEAALADNTNVQIDISSVNGLGNVFHRRRESGIDWEPGMEVSESGRTLVFVMDWRDHPLKDDAWYSRRMQKAIDDGLLHVFKQEVDRNYASAVEGILIQPEWFNSAINAHEELLMPELAEGGRAGALDVADEGGDRNAFAARKGLLLDFAEEWGERDTARTARRAVDICVKLGIKEAEYDCIGVGSGVKGEINRLADDGLLPRGLLFKPWNAGASPLRKDERLIEDDAESPLIGDFYDNLKAQGWWELARRFERTHRAVTEGVKYPADQLISISGSLPRLRQIQKELCQVTYTKSTRLKLKINKTPSGTRSPNIGDSVMMCYWPVDEASTYDATMSWV